jgi:hypothetical protein
MSDQAESPGDEARESRAARNVGVGCVTAVAGFFSGGMIGVFIAKVVGSIQGCEPPQGVPACNWPVYAVIGMGVGVLSLPSLVMWRLTRSDADPARR